ncbi:MAG: NUDIX domain-containing protein [Nitrospirae bacterium]|nr:NUDIX domain-containing protein [Nitrospirota bacterium]
MEESYEIIDMSGRVLGIAPRSAFHANPSLIHRVVHVLVFNHRGELLLQKRSVLKDIEPGKWDSSVGGHVNIGEDIRSAAEREMREELGIAVSSFSYLYDYVFSNQQETELVSTFSCIYEGSFRINNEEIDEIRFWDIDAIRKKLESGIFSSHLMQEFSRHEEFRRRVHHENG